MEISKELQADWAEMLEACDGDIDCAADAMHASGYSEEEIESVARPAARVEREEAPDPVEVANAADDREALCLGRLTRAAVQFGSLEGGLSAMRGDLYYSEAELGVATEQLLRGRPPVFRPFGKDDWRAYAGCGEEFNPHICDHFPTGGCTDAESYAIIAIYGSRKSGDFGLRLKFYGYDETKGGYANGAAAFRALLALRNGMPEADFLALFESF